MLAANGGELIDRVIDPEFGSNLPVSIAVLKVGGTIAAYGSAQKPEPVLPFYRMMYKDLTLHTIIVYSMPDSAKDHAVADIRTITASSDGVPAVVWNIAAGEAFGFETMLVTDPVAAADNVLDRLGL